MVLDEVFERFAQRTNVADMVRAALEHALSPLVIHFLFAQVAERQHTHTLMFSSVVDLMGAVVARIHPAVNSAYRAWAEAIGVSILALCDKLDRTEPGLSAELACRTGRTLGTVITAMGGERAARLPGHRVKVLDGNHLAST